MASNPAIPDASLLFDPVRDTYGGRLALVFGNEFAKGECPFYTAKQCYHCDIGAGEGTQFSTEMNKSRLEFFKQHYADVLPNIKHLVVYNSGSVLNRKEMSRETLGEILDYASSLDNCKVVSLDSREMYVTEGSLDYVVEHLREDQQTRIILGVESQSDEVRIGKLNKRMTKHGIERAFEVVGRYNGKVGIDINIVFQPPEVIGEDAIEEAVKTAEYGLDLAERYGVPVDFNFHAYYPSEKSKTMFPNHPRSLIGDEMEAIRRIRTLIVERSSNSQIFLGVFDEGHDQEPTIRRIEDIRYRRMFDLFNISQGKTFQ